MTHQARKRFGQHFLHDDSVIEHLIRVIAPKHQDNIVEIGPGQGALTKPLLDKVDKLHAIELDRDLAHRLEQTLDRERLHLHQADALRFDFSSLAKGPRSLRVVGNLPYNISTPLLFHLLSQIDVLQDMHFMLQQEVVDRLTAAPGNRHWGRLSIMVQYFCQAQFAFAVPPEAFHPPPAVNSAIIKLIPHKDPPWPVDDQQIFRQVVTQAFSQRRKTLGNALKSLLDRESLGRAGIDPALRPEQLSLRDYTVLANLLSSRS